MKFGQAMSIFEAALPDELAAPYREQLTRLQDSAPPMPTMTVRTILARELGADWKRPARRARPGPGGGRLDRAGAPAAGAGADGREVAVKVQYPGAAEALTSDLRQLARVARGLGPLVPGLDVKPLVAELQDRAVEELDYELEADAQRDVRGRVRDDPDIVVPDVVASSGTVLVTEWLESPGSLAQVIRDGTTGRARPLRPPLPALHVRGPRPHRHAARRPAPRELPARPRSRRQPGSARRARLRRGRPAARAPACRAPSAR